MLVQKLVELDCDKSYVCKKYSNKRFLRASVYAVDWAHANFEEEANMRGLVFKE